MFVGIDVGTTHLKLTIVSDSGAAVLDRVTRHSLLQRRSRLQDSMREAIQWLDLEARSIPEWEAIRGLAVSAVAPSIVLVDRAGNAHLAAIHTDGAPEQIQATPLETRMVRSTARLHAYLNLAHVKGPFRATSLTGYIVQQLSGSWTLDSTSAFEIGLGDERSSTALSVSGDTVVVPELSAPTQIVGECLSDSIAPPGTPVVAGATDTIASLVASGARQRDDAMHYFGSYLCRISLIDDIRPILSSVQRFDPPTRVELSLPQGGRLCWQILSDSFDQTGDDLASTVSDYLASVSVPESAQIPTCFIPPSNGRHSGVRPLLDIMGVDLLGLKGEFVPMAVLSVFGLSLRFEGVGRSPIRAYVAGGGTRIHEWVALTSALAGVRQFDTGEGRAAGGTAALARLAIDERLDDPIVTDIEPSTMPWMDNAFARFSEIAEERRRRVGAPSSEPDERPCD